VRLAGGAIPEGFEQHELVGSVDAAGPLKEDVARLGACGGREGGDTREPLVRDVGTDRELDGDKDRRCSLYSKQGFFCGARLPLRGRRPVAYRTCLTAKSQCGTWSGRDALHSED
jgi:hypothetical protein